MYFTVLSFLCVLCVLCGLCGLCGENLSLSSYQEFSKQLDTELQPVLRKEDFDTFHLEEAVSLMKEVGKRLE